ncbi:MAG: flippase [Patescibacteria group bacterium]
MLFKYIFKNTVFLLIARSVFKAFMAAMTIVLARFLGVENFGIYSTAVAFAAIFLVFNDLGMNTYLIREGSRDKTKLPVLFGNGLVIELIMSLILYFAIVVAAIILKYPPQVISLISLIAIATLIYEGRKIFEGVFCVNLKFKIIGWQQIFYSVLLFILTLLVVLKNPDLKNIAYVQIFVSVVILLFFIFILLKFLKPKVVLSQIYPMLTGAFAFCLSHFFFIIYFQTDTVILSIFKDSHDVGLYSAVYRLVVAIFIFSQIILQTCMPVIYRIAMSEREKLKRIYRVLVKYLGTFGLAASCGLFFLAKPIVLLAYGKKYEGAIIILQILAWFIFLKFLSSVFSTYLLSTSKQNRRAAIQGVAAFLNLVLNLILIPKFGFIAAAATTLFSEFFLAAVYYIITTRDFKEKMIFLFLPVLKSFLPAAVLALFLYFTKDYFNVIVTAILGAVIFGLSLWVFRFFGEYDKKLIKQIISRDTISKNTSNNIGQL